MKKRRGVREEKGTSYQHHTLVSDEADRDSDLSVFLLVVIPEFGFGWREA